MTGDAMNMERSTLERKDRAELAQVATALGIKVPSRAKKADIVSLILEIVAEPADAVSETNSRPARPPLPAPPTAPTRSGESATTSGTSTTSGSTSVQSTGDESSGRVPDATDGERATADVPASPAPSNGVSAASAEGDDASSASTDESGAADAAGDDAAPDGRTEDGDLDPNAEGGGRNRRRRRRGRDRGDAESAGGQSGEGEGETVEVSGLLDLRDDGYGFLRVKGFMPSRDDVYVSVKQCRQLGLRKGDHLTGLARPAGHKEKNPALTRVETVNGLDPEQARSRPRFDELTPVFPNEALGLDSPDGDLTTRLVDLVAPIGKGQRAIIVAPPKSGRTHLLHTVAAAIERNHPDTHLMVLLVDERPEEVTHFRQAVDGGEVISSTFDRPPEEHAAVAELTFEHAKRLVEYGNDVVVIADGITRLVRAYQLSGSAQSRVVAGGLDASALYPVKKLFGAGRALEEGGSLTVIATASVDTGAAMDQAIYEEFCAGSSMQLRLDRQAAAHGVLPAIDLDASSTRRVEDFVDAATLASRLEFRRSILDSVTGAAPSAVAEELVKRVEGSPSAAAVLASVASTPGS